MTHLVTKVLNSLIGRHNVDQLNQRQAATFADILMRTLIVYLLVGLGFLSPLTAQEAKEVPVVVELFTSQGCSSCPPADEMLAQLAQRDDVLALALHVDYWDYLGWTDEFAHPRFTKRQKIYALNSGDRTVYTPQFVVGGLTRVVGAQPVALMDAMRAVSGAGARVELRSSRLGDTLTIQARSVGPLRRAVAVQIVRFSPAERVEIEHGENEGKAITYANIVRDWQIVGEWTGAQPLSVTVPVQGSMPLAVILQETGQGAILAANRID